MLMVGEALEEWGVEAAGGLFILFSGTGSGFCPRFTGAELELWEFSHHCKSHYKSLQWWENSHSSSSAPVNLGQNPDPVPEKSINSPPAASTPHSSRALPTINISTLKKVVYISHCIAPVGYQTTFFTDTGQKKSWKMPVFLDRVGKMYSFWSELKNYRI